MTGAEEKTMVAKSRYSPLKTEHIENVNGLKVTINSYAIGPSGAYCAVTVDRGKNFLGSRIIPLTWVQKTKGKV